MSIDEQDKVCCAFNIKIQKLHSRLQEKDGVVIGEIESGSCSVSDQCLIMPSRTRIEMTNIYHEDNETKSCDHGQNVRLEFKKRGRSTFRIFIISHFLVKILRKSHVVLYDAIFNKNHVALRWTTL